MTMAWVVDEAQNTKERGKEHCEKGRGGERKHYKVLQKVLKRIEDD